ncbi:MAG: heme exporter protein CcmD [Gammaproteobacteria bacterium]|nr:MAG: heme exporter protein CcmD [Gammaproteobacteria bacterium]
MAEFFGMGGYGAYVWSAYAVFFVVLLIDALLPQFQRRATLRDIAARLRRESAPSRSAS